MVIVEELIKATVASTDTLYKQETTDCQPIGKQQTTVCQPIGKQKTTVCQPIGKQDTTVCQPIGKQETTVCQPIGKQETTVCQPIGKQETTVCQPIGKQETNYKGVLANSNAGYTLLRPLHQEEDRRSFSKVLQVFLANGIANVPSEHKFTRQYNTFLPFSNQYLQHFKTNLKIGDKLERELQDPSVSMQCLIKIKLKSKN